jgi:hypothetical protein
MIFLSSMPLKINFAPSTLTVSPFEKVKYKVADAAVGKHL